MDIDQVREVLSRVPGCTFASLDAETMPSPGLKCIETGASVILFSNMNSNGYENMVKRRLEKLGKTAENFVLGDLPWGERVENTPLIFHKDRYYLQTVILRPGEKEYLVGVHRVDPFEFGITVRRTNQGLPKGQEVLVATYRIENITRLTLLGEKHEKRPILSPKYA